ncbi:MAG: histidinol-phosphate transaminase [Acidobacteriota bacterium]
MMARLPLAIAPQVDRIVPYVPGKPIEEVERDLGLTETVKLASNENPLGPSPLAVEAIRQSARRVHRYPDGGAFYLKQRLAEALDVSPASLIVGNGSTEIVEMLAKTFLPPDGESLVSDGAFIMYRIATMAASATCRSVPMTRGLRHDLPGLVAGIGPQTRLVFIANPNNPTGTRVSRAELNAYFDAIPPHVLTVVDEAYREYIDEPDYPDATDALRAGHLVIVLRTFSKIHGLAGIRMGYGITTPAVVEALEKVRSPFNTSAVAQAAALAALDDAEHALRSRQANGAERARLEAALTARGITFVPSSANFVLMKPGPSGRDAFEALLRLGVIVRPMNGYGFPDHLRVSVGTVKENDCFLAALDAIRRQEGIATA